MQEKIQYHEVMSLGFKEEFCHDEVYFRENGFQYTIITLRLTKNIYIDWDKRTQLAEIVRLDKDYVHIKKKMPIRDLLHLKEIVDFYSDKENIQVYSSYPNAC